MDLVIENVGRRSKDWSEAGSPTDVGQRSLNGYERNVLFWNRGGGHFEEVAYLTHSNRIEDGRGVAVADFDRDGRQDLLVQNLEKPAVLLMARGEAGNWLQVELEGTESNRDALGAVVMAHVGDRKYARQVTSGSGFLASSSPVLHFGLGEATRVDALEVRWPSGRRERFDGVSVNRRLHLRESPATETAHSAR